MTNGTLIAGLAAPTQPWPVSVTEPATGAEFAEFVGGGAKDAAYAADVAARALPGWAGTPAVARAAALQTIADRLREPEPAAELAELTARETGKRLAEARAEVGMSAAFFSWFAAAAATRDDRVTRAVPGIRHQISHRPLGTVAVSTPWNFPLSIPARKIAAALAAGCTVLFKPSEVAPGSSLRLAEIVQEQLPEGVLCALLGDGAELTRVWLNDERVRGISFTGSTRIGLTVAELAARRLVRCVLELGGNAPFIVLDDADPSQAVDLIAGAKFRNNGQSCIAANTAWVPRSMLGEIVDGLAAAADGLVLGDPLDTHTTLGPLAPPGDPQRMTDLAEDARRRGATVHRSTAAVPDRGHYAAPVLAVDPPRDCRMVTEESFAPILPVLPYDDLADVLDHTRKAALGLAGYVAGTDLVRAIRVAEALDVGIVGVNTSTPNTPQIPFGGLKLSGIGWEGGQAGLDAFLTPQTTAVAEA
ncbi:aldehyde dehydrogenase family protein [Streptomyces sp. NPDC001228]|uniref:aldehyde dehydrogenase family protein n=1 Tax=Streptomyces sp. NPDC001228 TaxID=3154381 RepID=UPI003317EB30